MGNALEWVRWSPQTSVVTDDGGDAHKYDHGDRGKHAYQYRLLIILAFLAAPVKVLQLLTLPCCPPRMQCSPESEKRSLTSRNKDEFLSGRRTCGILV